MGEFGRWTAVELLRAYRQRQLSPVEVVASALARIEETQPRLNAFYEVHADQALREARESERRWRDGSPLGALDGIPTSIKDALPVRGSPSYRGSAANNAAGRSWDVDAPCVARLREAGAISLGRTTMPDFGILASGASTKHGVTRNPWDPSRNPGGSSAGAAAAIAAGIHPLAVGTDIVGSIRLPASFCGLFGHKPSQGRVPYYFPNSPALVAGPMARTVADAALLLTVIARPDRRDFTALPSGDVDYPEALAGDVPRGRIAILHHIGFGPPLDPEVAACFERGVALMAELGFEIVPVASPFEPAQQEAAEWFYRARYGAELSSFPPEVRKLSPVVHDWARPAGDLGAIDLIRHMNTVLRMREQAVRLLDGFAFLLMPTVPVPPYAAELPGLDPARIFDPWSNTFPFNFSEQPAASIACGLTRANQKCGGLPVGLQIVGHRFDDVGVLRLSRLFEEARGNFPMPEGNSEIIPAPSAKPVTAASP